MNTNTIELDRHFPPCGPCGLCGFHDARHRLWDAMQNLAGVGESAKDIAWMYDKPLEAVEAVLRLRPYADDPFFDLTDVRPCLGPKGGGE